MERSWKGTTFGTRWMHRSLTWMIKVSDVRIFYAISAIFIIPVYLIFGSGYGVAYDFYRRRIGAGRVRSFFMVGRNFYSFSKVVVDKFAMGAGKRFEIMVEGYPEFTEVYSRKDSVMQFSAHVGNFEIAGFSLKSGLKPINAVVFGGEKATVMETRERLLKKNNMKTIPVREGVDHIFLIDEALQKGEAVSLPADRILGSSKTIKTLFFGSEARFPAGPFRLATMRGSEVLAINVMKQSWKTYRIYVTRLRYDREAPRAEQTRQLAAAYAAELERIVRMYPEQWYNFYDFWAA